MARTVKDRKLDSKAARAQLPRRPAHLNGKPHYRKIASDLHLGFRQGKGGGGTWVARLYKGNGKYLVKKIGRADDDLHDADGTSVLSFDDALEHALAWRSKQAIDDTPPLPGCYTVSDAVAAYLEYLDHEKKSGYEVRHRMEAHVLPTLGDRPVAKLTTDELRKWHRGLAKLPPRVRSKKGAEQRHRAIDFTDEETVRRRRVSANRCLSQLKAALNYAWHEGMLGEHASDNAWRRVKPFKGVDEARVRYLTFAQCRRLLNACDPDFRLLVRAALETGARYGELTRLKCEDFNTDTGTVFIRVSKTGKSRHIDLTDEGREFFRRCVAGRAGNEFLFRNLGRVERATKRERERLARLDHAAADIAIHDDGQWRKSEQARPMLEACRRAKINPPLGFHQLRHTWASLALMNGMDRLVVARNLGHSDLRMVMKHYGHISDEYIRKTITEHGPKFGLERSNVRSVA